MTRPPRDVDGARSKDPVPVELAFIDFETRSPADLPAIGALPYARHPETDILALGWAYEHGKAHVWSPLWCWESNSGNDVQALGTLFEKIERGDVLVVAWNMFFDRNIWNHVFARKHGAPDLPLEQTLCAMAQAEASVLPGSLEKAAEALRTHYRKDPKGKKLINQLCMGTRGNWDRALEAPAIMGHFRKYCGFDVLAMRDIWQCTRPLSWSEWQEYHASERINERGVAVDVEFAYAATQYAQAEQRDLNERMLALTGDPKLTLSAHLRKARWLYDNLWPCEELQSAVEKAPKITKTLDPETREVISEETKRRFSCDRSTRDYVAAVLENAEYADLFEPEQLQRVQEFLELVEMGNSAAVRKFTAMVTQCYNGRLYGQYTFNGAGQTGRFSGRGVQVHNLIGLGVEKPASDARADVLEARNRAVDAMEDILAGASPEALTDVYGLSISRLLARLLRPSFIATP